MAAILAQDSKLLHHQSMLFCIDKHIGSNDQAHGSLGKPAFFRIFTISRNMAGCSFPNAGKDLNNSCSRMTGKPTFGGGRSSATVFAPFLLINNGFPDILT